MLQWITGLNFAGIRKKTIQFILDSIAISFVDYVLNPEGALTVTGVDSLRFANIDLDVGTCNARLSVLGCPIRILRGCVKTIDLKVVLAITRSDWMLEDVEIDISPTLLFQNDPRHFFHSSSRLMEGLLFELMDLSRDAANRLTGQQEDFVDATFDDTKGNTKTAGDADSLMKWLIKYSPNIMMILKNLRVNVVGLNEVIECAELRIQTRQPAPDAPLVASQSSTAKDKDGTGLSQNKSGECSTGHKLTGGSSEEGLGGTPPVRFDVEILGLNIQNDIKEKITRYEVSRVIFTVSVCLLENGDPNWTISMIEEDTTATTEPLEITISSAPPIPLDVLIANHDSRSKSKTSERRINSVPEQKSEIEPRTPKAMWRRLQSALFESPEVFGLVSPDISVSSTHNRPSTLQDVLSARFEQRKLRKGLRILSICAIDFWLTVLKRLSVGLDLGPSPFQPRSYSGNRSVRRNEPYSRHSEPLLKFGGPEEETTALRFYERLDEATHRHLSFLELIFLDRLPVSPLSHASASTHGGVSSLDVPPSALNELLTLFPIGFLSELWLQIAFKYYSVPSEDALKRHATDLLSPGSGIEVQANVLDDKYKQQYRNDTMTENGSSGKKVSNQTTRAEGDSRDEYRSSSGNDQAEPQTGEEGLEVLFSELLLLPAFFSTHSLRSCKDSRQRSMMIAQRITNSFPWKVKRLQSETGDEIFHLKDLFDPDIFRSSRRSPEDFVAAAFSELRDILFTLTHHQLGISDGTHEPLFESKMSSYPSNHTNGRSKNKSPYQGSDNGEDPSSLIRMGIFQQRATPGPMALCEISYLYYFWQLDVEEDNRRARSIARKHRNWRKSAKTLEGHERLLLQECFQRIAYDPLPRRETLIRQRLVINAESVLLLSSHLPGLSPEKIDDALQFLDNWCHIATPLIGSLQRCFEECNSNELFSHSILFASLWFNGSALACATLPTTHPGYKKNAEKTSSLSQRSLWARCSSVSTHQRNHPSHSSLNDSTREEFQAEGTFQSSVVLLNEGRHAANCGFSDPHSHTSSGHADGDENNQATTTNPLRYQQINQQAFECKLLPSKPSLSTRVNKKWSKSSNRTASQRDIVASSHISQKSIETSTLNPQTENSIPQLSIHDIIHVLQSGWGYSMAAHSARAPNQRATRESSGEEVRAEGGITMLILALAQRRLTTIRLKRPVTLNVKRSHLDHHLSGRHLDEGVTREDRFDWTPDVHLTLGPLLYSVRRHVPASSSLLTHHNFCCDGLQMTLKEKSRGHGESIQKNEETRMKVVLKAQMDSLGIPWLEASWSLCTSSIKEIKVRASPLTLESDVQTWFHLNRPKATLPDSLVTLTAPQKYACSQKVELSKRRDHDDILDFYASQFGLTILKELTNWHHHASVSRVSEESDVLERLVESHHQLFKRFKRYHPTILPQVTSSAQHNGRVSKANSHLSQDTDVIVASSPTAPSTTTISDTISISTGAWLYRVISSDKDGVNTSFTNLKGDESKVGETTMMPKFEFLLETNDDRVTMKGGDDQWMLPRSDIDLWRHLISEEFRTRIDILRAMMGVDHGNIALGDSNRSLKGQRHRKDESNPLHQIATRIGERCITMPLRTKTHVDAVFKVARTLLYSQDDR